MAAAGSGRAASLQCRRTPTRTRMSAGARADRGGCALPLPAPRRSGGRAQDRSTPGTSATARRWPRSSTRARSAASRSALASTRARSSSGQSRSENSAFFADRRQGHLMAVMIGIEYLDIFHDIPRHRHQRPSRWTRRSWWICSEISGSTITWAYARRLRERASARSRPSRACSRGIGDTIRISYASDPVYGSRTGWNCYSLGSSRAGRGPDRVPDLRASGGPVHAVQDVRRSGGRIACRWSR